MKRMWSVLRVGLIIGATVTLVSCNVIQGELTLLVEEKGSAYSPCWSSDGSKIYFISSWDSLGNYTTDRVWSIVIEDGTRELISEEEVWEMDVSYEGDLCLPYFPNEDDWIRVFDLETWIPLDSIRPENYYGYPKFSLESNQIIYYIYRESGSDSTFLHKVNLAESTDEIVLHAGRGYDFAPGPGDTLFAIGDTIYNLNSKERVPIGIDIEHIESMNWNPAYATELVITTGTEEDLFIFNLETLKLHRLDTRSIDADIIEDARFSPNGERMVFTVKMGPEFLRHQIWIFDPAN